MFPSLPGRSIITHAKSFGLVTASRRCLHGTRTGTATTATSATTKHQSSHTHTNNRTNARIIKTLYRQILRWCAAAPPDLPLTTLVPPVHLEAPGDVDAFGLEMLAMSPSHLDDANVTRIRSLLPPVHIITPQAMTVPIHSVHDIRQLVRSVFRLNREPRDDDGVHLKPRLTATFTTLKSLNELSTNTLDAIHAQRQLHQDTSGIKFCVGQVVQHKQERWRGVVAKWTRRRRQPPPHVSSSSTSRGKTSSLTTKDYSGITRHKGEDNNSTTMASNNTNTNNNITYDVVLDAGDAHSMGSASGWAQAGPSDLQLVDDSALIRIQSSLLGDYFTHFDATTKRFVANDLVTYQFPADHIPDPMARTWLDQTATQRCVQITTAVHDMAKRLERCILDETSCPKDRGCILLDTLLERLRDLASGKVTMASPKGLLLRYDRHYPLAPTTRVARHLDILLQIQTEIVDLNFRRRHAVEHKPKIRFGLGDIVKHKKYNFRGVVVAWDAKPVVDVRRWDGLQGIDNVMEKPFYQVIPDQNDCIQAFGGERSARYVCQDNLDVCPPDECTGLLVDMEPDWIQSAENRYEAPQTIKYSFGDDLKDDGVTERCLKRIQDEFNSLFLLARQQDKPLDELATHLSTQNLFAFLQLVDNAQDAHVVQELIKEYRKAHSRRDLCWRLYSGIPELLNGKVQNAMDIYEQVVGEDPTFAEGWNRLATCQYISGKYDESRKSTQKALELDPYHLQAISGSGLLHYEAEEYEAAAKCFRQALSLDPWLGVGSKLSQTLDILDNIVIREELGDN